MVDKLEQWLDDLAGMLATQVIKLVPKRYQRK
jgi:hypothetical protein